MSQTGKIISVANRWGGDGTIAWVVQYQYALDAGGLQLAEVIVGTGFNAQVGLWSSPTGTITVPTNPPGVVTGGPILLPCPLQIQYALFGVSALISAGGGAV